MVYHTRNHNGVYQHGRPIRYEINVQVLTVALEGVSLLISEIEIDNACPTLSTACCDKQLTVPRCRFCLLKYTSTNTAFLWTCIASFMKN